MNRWKRLGAAALMLALLAGLFARAEEIMTAPVEEAPGEIGEVALVSPPPTDTPEPVAPPTPEPTLAPGSINYPPEKTDFEDEIWVALTRRWGLADFQAAGLMSSIRAESGFCPYNAQHTATADDRENYTFRVGDGEGFGLCQWTFKARKQALYDYAVACGDAMLVWDFDVQMAFLYREIDLAALKATRTLYDATEWVVLNYEKPSQRYRNSWPGTRYGYSLAIYKRHTGRDYPEPALRFAASTPDGNDAAEGIALGAEGGALTVRSNYYWRVASDADWLAIRSPDADGAPCRCGYVADGDAALALVVTRMPPVDAAALTFDIYRGEGVQVVVPVAYTGVTLPQFLADRIAGFLRAHADWLRLGAALWPEG